MSPTNFFLDFDNLFQINPAERFGTEELESFDEEFAALLSSFVNNNPLPSALPMVKENLPEKTFEQTGETLAEFPQIPVGFEPTIENGKTPIHEFPTINHILQPTNLFRAEGSGLPDCDVKPIQTELTEMLEVEGETLQFNPIQNKSDNSPKAAGTIDNTVHFAQADSEDKSIPENKTVESQNKLETLALEQSKQAEPSVQTAFHAGEFDTKKINQSKKILAADKDVKIERQHKNPKQFEFEKKQYLPILQADDVTTTKPKTSANFQTVLENFSENSSPAPALKKIKLESASTAFYEQPTTQENFVNELSGAKSQPVNFEQFVENVPEQVIEPMIVLAKETGKSDAPRTVKIKLNPEELGTVEISLEGNAAGKLNAELVTETKTAEAVLNQNINELQKALEHSGWQIETLTISCADTNSGQSEKQSQQAENRQNFDNFSFAPESETVSTEADDRLLSVRA